MLHKPQTYTPIGFNAPPLKQGGSGMERSLFRDTQLGSEDPVLLFLEIQRKKTKK